MSVKLKELFVPEGELLRDWFPEVDAEAFVKRRLHRARDAPRFSDLTDPDRDKALKAYVYEQAYRHIYRRKAEDPSSWSADGEGSAQQSDRQVQRWKELADEKEDEWTTLLEEPDPDREIPPTTSVQSRTGYA